MSATEIADANVYAPYLRCCSTPGTAPIAADFAALFADDGVAVGFDGSEMAGRDAIEGQLGEIFAGHETGAYVGMVRDVRRLGSRRRRCCTRSRAWCRRAIRRRPGAQRRAGAGRRGALGHLAAVLYQNTPGPFHGRPELCERLSEELRHELQTRA